MISRNKPGHWPKYETLRRSSECGMFLVSPGIPTFGSEVRFHANASVRYCTIRSRGSDDFSKQWRMSTNMIERMLMFDLNIVQLKAYTIIKMLRKELFKHFVGDRFSTFHMKTAFLFTVENTPEERWTDRNLVACVVCCLKTLARFLKRRFCPHYTIADVNLFAGKLHTHEYTRLISKVSELVSSNLIYVLFMKMDEIGMRLTSVLYPENCGDVGRQEPDREDCQWFIFMQFRENMVINPVVLHMLLEMRMRRTEHDDTYKSYLSSFLSNLETAESNSPDKIAQTLESENIRSALSTMEASTCIEANRCVSHDIIEQFRKSNESGQLACQLKYASMLYVTGQYQKVAEVLTEAEIRIKPALDLVTGCSPTKKLDTTLIKNALQLIKNVDPPVVFTRYERHCVPRHLLYELYGTCYETPMDKANQQCLNIILMNNILVDTLSFLYYLQYRTYRRLENQPLKTTAFKKLQNHVIGSLDSELDKRETDATNRRRSLSALSMLAHSFELENQELNAWLTYTLSLRHRSLNNAAVWHLSRLLCHRIHGTT
ncbi:hypothetical protein DPMN_063050 [Dreissena polymorpha]|uniref:Mab-21-like HhH/H2TH-like domain-containing protein n=1 Tax=Dreissena polymorpha TaxID=45954 RepID=A0A9D4HKQ7_DREPO|nr:hypothetical protein DPMN_063050 [Dreissena polymorpha]